MRPERDFSMVMRSGCELAQRPLLLVSGLVERPGLVNGVTDG